MFSADLVLRSVGERDYISISIWDEMKYVKREMTAGFLGCVKLLPGDLHLLKDAGGEGSRPFKLEKLENLTR